MAAAAVSLCFTLSQPALASPRSTPAAVTTCAVLSPESKGDAVATIQKVIGADTDGDFGPATQKLLKHWQKAHTLPTTGVVDAATWAALPPAAASRACGQKVTGAGVAVSCTALSMHSSGLAVVVLQKALGITADGEFGAATAKAVRQLQADSKLPVNGVAESTTWHALKLLGTPACSTTKSVGPHESKDQKAQAKIRSQVVQLADTLEQKPGTTKNQVALQAVAFAQKQLGKPYVYGAIGPKSYDCSGLQMTSYLHAGIAIPRVSAAQYAGGGTQVPLDQAKQGDLLFFASDVTKPATVYHVSMYVGGGNIIEAPHTGANVQVVPLRTTDLLPMVVRPVATLSLPLIKGDTGASVTQLQQMLNRHGAGLTVDGGYGAATVQAVRAWQQAHDLPVTGKVHLTTWLSLAWPGASAA